MKLIVDTDDTALYMKTLYSASEKAVEYMKKTNLAEIRSRKPKYSTKDTDVMKRQKLKIQAQKNMADMLKIIMTESPEDAIEIAKMFIVLDDGEEYPTGAKMFDIVIKVFTDREIADFFTLQSQLGQLNLKD